MSRWSAVFLDRDGTLNVKQPEGSYVTRPSEMVLLPGAAQALRRLRGAGIPVYVVTNQRGVARGRMSIRDLDAVHDRMLTLLAGAGAGVDQIYSCVHDTGACGCRKPLPGLLHRAAADHGVDLARSVMVGDAAGDVRAGAAAGCVTIRLAATEDASATVTCATVAEAVRWILRTPAGRPAGRSGRGRAP